MTVTVKDIYSYIDEFAPFASAMDFDNCGILAGDETAQINTVLAALDITPGVIEEAVQYGAQLIISHHPVIFHPLKALPCSSPAALLIKNNISAICAHTNLDLSPSGVNICLANALQLQNALLLDGECAAVGTLKNPMNAREFAVYVKQQLNCSGVRFTDNNKTLHTVAVSSGAGGDSVYTVGKHDADVLVTGEIKHSQILDALSAGLAVVDAGHFKTENIVIKPLVQMLSCRFPSVRFIESERCTDGIEYV